jgi:UDP-N-acetylmuramate dehydrogenase
VPLASLTRYGIGGPTPRFARVSTTEELVSALLACAGSGYRLLGWGANVLVSDRGTAEPVLILAGEFDFVKVTDDAIETGAAAGLPSLVGDARRESRAGWDFLEAVPGSVGGGLRMNAGSTETGLWDRALWVDAVMPSGEKVRLTPEEAAPTYRAVGLPDAWVFVAARFAAPAGDPVQIQATHADRRRRKVATQVYELPSCGSIWKNPGPPHGSAWELVERAGMRGAVRGGARITERHANFIANIGGASAADVLWLMSETRRRVHEEAGVWLEPEICLWGFDERELAAVGGAP